MTDDTRCVAIFSDGTECERARMCQRYLLRDDLGPNTQTMRAVCLVNDGFFEKQVPVMRAAA